jgi:hypothetical protein
MILNNLPDKLIVFLAIKRWVAKYKITSEDGGLENMSFIQFLRKEITFDCRGTALKEVQKEIRKIKTKHMYRVNSNWCI